MATKKTPIASDEKLEDTDFDLFKAIDAVDKKDYGYYSRLNEEQQRKFVPYLMIHWISAVKSNGMLGAYYVISTDVNANKYMFDENIQRHGNLQWLMLCAASPGVGKQFHQWIPHLKASFGELKQPAVKKEVKEYFTKVYSKASSADIDTAADEYTTSQHHRVKLAKIFPTMKIADIESLSRYVTSSDINEYEKSSGN